jgi:putative acetyltransferase
VWLKGLPKRFGFRNYPELVHEGIPQEVFLVLPFTEKVPKGIVVFHEGFLAKSSEQSNL